MPRRLPPRQDMFKTKLCPYSKPGSYCTQPNCSYAHFKAELRPPPNLYHTKLCPFIIHERVCKKKNCGYAHNSHEIEGHKIDEVFYKSQICHFWPDNCKNGNRCRFAHGSFDLQKPRTDIPAHTVRPNKSSLTSLQDQLEQTTQEIDVVDLSDQESKICDPLVLSDISEIETASTLSMNFSQSHKQQEIGTLSKFNMDDVCSMTDTVSSKSSNNIQFQSSSDSNFSASNELTKSNAEFLASNELMKSHLNAISPITLAHLELSPTSRSSRYSLSPNLYFENDIYSLHQTHNYHPLIKLTNSGCSLNQYCYED